MRPQREPMMQAIKNISTANNWRKEIVGIPTYVAAALISWSYAGSSVVGSLLILVCFMMIYAHVYEFIFPKFEASKSLAKLAMFFIAQALFWAVVLILQSLK